MGSFLYLILSFITLSATSSSSPNTCSNPRTISTMNTNEAKASVAGFLDGGWVMFYVNTQGQVLFSLYDSSSQPINTPTLVSDATDTFPSNYIKTIHACARRDGVFAAVWRTSSNGIQMGIYSRTGNLITRDSQVNDDGSQAVHVSISCLQDSSFAAIWGDNSNYYFKLYNSAGNVVQTATQGPSAYSGTVGYVYSSGISGNNFAVCYSGNTGKSALAMSIITSAGAIVGSEIVVDNSGNGLDGCAVSQTDDYYNFVVSWIYSGSNNVYIQRYTPSGTLNSSTISVAGGNPTGSVSITPITNGFLVGWFDSTTGFYVRKLGLSLNFIGSSSNIPGTTDMLSFTNCMVNRSNNNIVFVYSTSNLPTKMIYYELDSTSLALVNNQTSFCSQSEFPYCGSSLSTCFTCFTSSACTSSQYCNGGYCLNKQCFSNSDCNSTLPFCKLTPNYNCVECLVTSDCTNILKPFCSNNKCICQTNADCPAGRACSIFSQDCVNRCNTSSDCSISLPTCLPTSKYCMACTNNSDCSEIPNGMCYTFTGQCRSRNGPGVRNITQQSDPFNTILITFTSDVIFYKSLYSIIDVTILGISRSQYDYSLAQISNRVVNLTLYPVSFIISPQIFINFTDIYNVSDENYTIMAGNTTFIFNLTNNIWYIPRDRDVVSQLSTYNNIITQIALYSSLVIFAVTDQGYYANLIFNVFQNCYFLWFFNIKYPENVNTFLQKYEVGSFSFIPNPFSDYNMKNKTIGDVPERFKALNYSSNFIHNIGELLTFWFFLVSFVLLVVFLKLVLTKCEKSWGWLDFLHEKFIWNFLFRTYSATYLPLQFYAVLQFSTFSFDGSENTFDSAIALITFIINMLIPLITLASLHRRFDKLPSRDNSLYLIFQEYTENIKLLKLSSSIFFLMKSLYSIIVVLAGNPFPLQGFIILAIDVMSIGFLIMFKPLRKKGQLFGEIIAHIFIMILHILAIAFYFNFSDTQTNLTKSAYDFGWGIIIVCTIISTVILIIMVWQIVLLGLILYANKGMIPNHNRVYPQKKIAKMIVMLEKERTENGERESFIVEDVVGRKDTEEKEPAKVKVLVPELHKVGSQTNLLTELDQIVSQREKGLLVTTETTNSPPNSAKNDSKFGQPTKTSTLEFKSPMPDFKRMISGEEY